MEYPPAPYVFPTTQRFDGDDGPWSTFKLAVGTPEQHFRILPSLASSFIWLPRMGACNNTDLGTCADARGIEPFLSLNHGGFEASQSSSWARISLGEFSLNLGWLDIGLLYGDAYKEIWSYIGTERISFQGGRQKTGFTVNNSLVAGYVDEKIKLGMIGLTTNKFDLQREREIRQFTSMLGMLAGADGYNMSIPSESYSYTAGASYRNVSERFGSLILGGYDEVIATRTRVPFTVQKNRDLVVVVQGIVVKARTDQSAMSTYTRSTFDAVIDTTLPYLWLPEAVCDRFQSIFNLVFDDDSDLYTINETAHNLNMANNPTVIITLSDPTNSTERVSIEIPYRAFFLEIPSSIRTNASHYFPIRRSENQIRFTLGRTLLQESYIIVDYEHDQFSITQVDWSSRNTGNRSIVPIHKRGYVPPKPEEDGLSTGAILGIVVGLLLSVLLVALLIWLAIRRRRTEKDEKEQ
ncbi:acid protease, partial [Patellaria atrata CBS 101060]